MDVAVLLEREGCVELTSHEMHLGVDISPQTLRRRDYYLKFEVCS